MQSLIILSILSVGLNYFMGWYLIQASAYRRGYQGDTLSTTIDSLYKPYRRLYYYWYQKKVEVKKFPRLWIDLIICFGGSLMIIVIDIWDVASMFAENNIKLHVGVGLIVRAACLIFFLCSPLLARPIGRS
jgi:hypothetical protein